MRIPSKCTLPIKILLVEFIGFLLVIFFLWIDEIYDLPHLLFGSAPTSVNIAESAFETLIILCFGLLIGYITYLCAKKLQRLNNERDMLFSIISHDIKSPFTYLVTSTELLRKNLSKWPEEKIVQYVNTILNSSKKLLDLIENLLQWSQLQSAGKKHHLEQIAVDDLAQANIDLLLANASAKNISLRSTVDAHTFVYADRTMLNSVMRNLLSNAVKFTQDGGSVEISSKSSGNEVGISVSDNGIGMNSATINKLFRLESCCSLRGTAGEQGTGLGLILCKALVKNMGGRITVKSESGKGSTFTFTLPKGAGTTGMNDGQREPRET